MIPRWSRMLFIATGVMLATFVVIALVMYLFDPPHAIEEAVYDHLVDDVQVIDLGADPALKKALEDSLAGRAPPVEVENPRKRAGGYSVPPHQVKGFVQVEVKLDATGKVIDARVVGAIPPGIYDQQALMQVRGRSYTPITIDGKAVPGKVTEVVPFTVESPRKGH